MSLRDPTLGRRTPARRTLRAAALAGLVLSMSPVPQEAGAETAKEELRWLDPSAPDYRTPRAGEGFRTRVLGRDVEVETRDRRSTSAWDLGVGLWYPSPEGRLVLPFGAAYLWRRPDEQSFFRGTVALVHNDLVYARSLDPEGPLEGVLGFENRTVPIASSERVDGERIDAEQVMWGLVRGAAGLGVRRQVEAGFEGFAFTDEVDPQAPDNMASASLTLEPGFLYFDKGDDAADDFEAPSTTFTLDAHFALRWDALERNLLDLAHHGFSLGFDARAGWRAEWEDWGIDDSESADRTRHPVLLQSHLVLVDGVPWSRSERQRLIGSVHAGWGDALDRFSAPRLGGGPSSEEFMSISRPIVPGASIGEFFPDHYAVAIAEYRYELFFFTYLSARASLAWLDRERLRGDESIHSENNVLPSIGARLTTGFVFKTRLQLDYNYAFDVIREENRGGNEVVLHISRSF